MYSIQYSIKRLVMLQVTYIYIQCILYNNIYVYFARMLHKGAVADVLYCYEYI